MDPIDPTILGLLLIPWAAFCVIGLCYFLTILPFLPQTFINYIDKRIKERVDVKVKELLAEKQEELMSLNTRKKKTEDTIILIKESVGRKLSKDELPPLSPIK